MRVNALLLRKRALISILPSLYTNNNKMLVRNATTNEPITRFLKPQSNPYSHDRPKKRALERQESEKQALLIDLQNTILNHLESGKNFVIGFYWVDFSYGIKVHQRGRVDW